MDNRLTQYTDVFYRSAQDWGGGVYGPLANPPAQPGPGAARVRPSVDVSSIYQAAFKLYQTVQQVPAAKENATIAGLATQINTLAGQAHQNPAHAAQYQSQIATALQQLDKAIQNPQSGIQEGFAAQIYGAMQPLRALSGNQEARVEQDLGTANQVADNTVQQLKTV
jgi:hypothetical protein